VFINGVRMLKKDTIVAALKKDLEAMDVCRAATLGGSDANERADDMSDIDLFLIVTPGSVEAAAGAIEQTLAGLSPISVKYRMPMPNWHGFNQAFYQLSDAPESLMVDWLMIETGVKHPWFEVERHGHHQVLFDKDGIVKEERVDREALRKQIETKAADLRVKYRLFRHLAPKNAKRGLPADAMHFYQSLVLRPLVDMARIVHCPERFDYGFRYIRSDLPPEMYDTVVRLSYPASIEAIDANCAEVGRLMERLFKEYDAKRTAG
jgi:hypothetical protein